MDYNQITQLNPEELYNKAHEFKQNNDYDNYFIYLTMSANKDYELAKRDFEIQFINENVDRQDYVKTKPFYDFTQEYSYSLCMIGYIHLFDNKGVKHNYNYAKECFEKVADTNCFASYQLAHMHVKYLHGYTNYIIAFPLYKQAATLGSLMNCVFLFVAVKLELIQPLQVKPQAAFAAKNFQPKEVFTTGGKTCSHKITKGPIFKICKKVHTVIRIDSSNRSVFFFTFLDKHFFLSANGCNFPNQETGQIHCMSIHITLSARTGFFLIVSPNVRKFRINKPVLIINGIEMMYFS